MALRFTCPKPLNKKKRSHGNLRLLNMLDKYINDTQVVPITILTKFWADQAAAITYKEIRELIERGEVTNEDLQNWSQDYSILVDTKLSKMWEDAIIVGNISGMLIEGLKNSDFNFNATDEGVKRWVEERGADFVTNSVTEQRIAIKRLTRMAIREEISPRELAQIIRPCIGLTKHQAEATVKYYQRIKENLQREHPRMRQATAEKKAKNAALKYAERQHRFRAETIAQTELAEAYNQGAHFSIKQAQEMGYIGHVRKVWVTAREDRVCKHCAAVEGVQKEIDELFDVGKCGFKNIPPAHPRCRCVVKYVEVKEERR